MVENFKGVNKELEKMVHRSIYFSNGQQTKQQKNVWFDNNIFFFNFDFLFLAWQFCGKSYRKNDQNYHNFFFERMYIIQQPLRTMV